MTVTGHGMLTPLRAAKEGRFLEAEWFSSLLSGLSSLGCEHMLKVIEGWDSSKSYYQP